MAYVNPYSLNRPRKHGLPPTVPVPAMIQTLACRWMPLNYLEWCHTHYGERFTMYPVGMSPVVFLSNPKDIHAVVSASSHVLHPGAGGAAIAPIVGDDSFMLQDEDEHLNGRRTILPAFRPIAVRERVEMVAEVIRHEIDSWPLNTVFPAHSRLRSLSLRVILRTVFGDETTDLRVLHSRILDMLSVTTTLVIQQPRLRHLPGWRGTWGKFIRRRRDVDEIIAGLITRARRMQGDQDNLFGTLLQAHNNDGSPMSDKQVRDHLMSVILAGHETTASELAWAFQLIAHNQPVQDRLIEEIGSGAGGDEYLTATIQEVLRHRPVFLFAIPRVVVEPIEIGGWTYRPPAQLLGCIYLMHHDPMLYPDPYEFRPERFLEIQPHPRIWLPWGGGRKRCPGHRRAINEMHAVLRATLATRRIMPVAPRMEHARWRSAIVTPHAGSQIILREHRHLSSHLESFI